jgi:hypothetical protein
VLAGASCAQAQIVTDSAVGSGDWLALFMKSSTNFRELRSHWQIRVRDHRDKVPEEDTTPMESKTRNADKIFSAHAPWL